MTDIPVPLAIHRGERDLTITWAPDHRGIYAARELRIQCHCAQCRDEFTGRLLLEPGAVPDDITARRVELVGSYAIRIDWSDGHGTGIYTYQYLRSLCPCPACHAARTDEMNESAGQRRPAP